MTNLTEKLKKIKEEEEAFKQKQEEEKKAFKKKLQETQAALMEKIIQEYAEIFRKLQAYSIDKKQLAGFIMFAQNPENKNSPILKQFEDLSNNKTLPSKPTKSNKKQQSSKAA